jgi:glycosyltransferase involved in cell wall biosynthesis
MPFQFPRRTNPAHAKIPSVVHYIFGLKKAREPFGLVHYLAVASALNVLKPQRVIIHHGFGQPAGLYWDLVRDHVELKQARAVDEIFGNPVDDYAHKADLIRIEALMKYGGISLDLDVWVLRPFDDLLGNDFVMGQEGPPRGRDGVIGLCNAVILSSAKSKFLKRWYNSYRSFNGPQGDYQLPTLLAKQYPSEIALLPYDRFFSPTWRHSTLKAMYAENTYGYASNYAVHTWESASRDYLEGFSMSWLFECRSTLLSMMRAYVPNPLISVIVPCYEQRKYIRESIDSIVAQKWPLWELIVVDDGSTDSCGTYVNDLSKTEYRGVPQLQESLTVIIQENQGLAAARNEGIRQARGLWICVLDADDRIGPDYFLEAERAMSRAPRVNVIYSDQEFFGESTGHWNVPGLDFQQSLMTGPLPVMTLYRRSLWMDVGGYSDALPWGNEDWDFWLKLVEVGARGTKLDGTHTYYRYKHNSMMRDAADEVKTERAMLRTRHPDLYNVATLLESQNEIARMSGKTYMRLVKLSKSSSIGRESRACNMFWRALRAWRDKRLQDAEDLVTEVIGIDGEALSWQPRYFLAMLLCNSGRQSDGTRMLNLLSTHISLYKSYSYRDLVGSCAP